MIFWLKTLKGVISFLICYLRNKVIEAYGALSASCIVCTGRANYVYANRY